MRSSRLAPSLLCLMLVVAACGECGGCGEGQAPAAQTAPLVAAEAPDQPAAPAPREPDNSVWKRVSVDDKVPICVFGNYKDFYESSYPDDVRPTEIKAGEPVHFGAWPGWCVNGACDDKPSLQCNVEQEGQVLVVHTRYWGRRKDVADCGGETCQSIFAGCQTEPLEAGAYLVRYGDLTFNLQIPSTPGDPCFGMRDRIYPGPDAL